MMHALQRLTIGRRLLLIALSFVVPIAVMAGLIVQGMSKDIAFAQLERDGVSYLRPLNALLGAVAEHQLASGDAAEQARAAEEVNRAFGAVEQAQAAVGTELQFTPEGLGSRQRSHVALETVRSEWASLEREAATLSPTAVDERHQHLIDDVRTMIAHVGDTSNLILDPDLDSYYVMDTAVIVVPQTQARLGRVNRIADRLLANDSTLAEQIGPLGVLGAMLRENDADHVQGDVQTAVNEDTRFYGASPTLASKLKPAADAYVKATSTVIDTVGALTAGTAGTSADTLDKAVHAARATATTLADTSSSELDALLSARLDSLSFSRLQALGLSALAVLAALALVFFISRSVTVPLIRTTQEMTEGARQVTATSEQVAAASQGLSQGATEQASSLEETSASMEEMASMTRRNAEHTREASTLVADVHTRVHESHEVLTEMVQSMGAIQESSQQVSRIIKTIDEIAFQTNILALNAAVEAARAGEAGLGFAVVAEEVRNLAQRSAQAARDTAALIEESIVRAKTGNHKVEQVASAITGITDSVNRVRGLVQEVAEASAQQAQGIDQVTQALTQMEKVTQTTAATAEESAATSEELNAQAAITMEAIDHLRAMVGSAAIEGHAPRRTARPAPVAAARKLPLQMPPRKSTARATSSEDELPLAPTGTFGSF